MYIFFSIHFKSEVSYVKYFYIRNVTSLKQTRVWGHLKLIIVEFMLDIHSDV